MLCSNCGKEITEGNRFCGFCGAEQVRPKCSSCGHDLAEPAKFCPYCGAAADEPSLPSAQPAAGPTHQPSGVAREAIAEIPREATAGVGRRFAATIIDGIVLFMVGYLMAVITGQTSQGGFNLQGASAFVWFLIGIAYYIVMEAMFGATVGKMACGMKVLKTDGSSMDWNASMIRNILRIIDGLFVYLIGAILVWTSPLRQRLGDRAAHTVVVKKASLLAEEGKYNGIFFEAQER